MNRAFILLCINLGLMAPITAMKIKKISKQSEFFKKSIINNKQKAWYSQEKGRFFGRPYEFVEKKVDLPKNIHKTIFPEYYAENLSYDYVKIEPNMSAIARAVTKPDFSEDDAARYVQAAAYAFGMSEYNTSRSTQSVMRPFLSFAFFLATQYKKRNDSSINKKYANLIDQIFRKSWIGFNEPLWNGNHMWDSVQQHPQNPQDASLPLHKAVKYDLQELVPMLFNLSDLLHRGALQVNGMDHKERTPLHYVQSVDVAQVLIDKGAHVGQQDSTKNTPLHLCPSYLVPFLIKHGASPSSKNNYQRNIVRTWIQEEKDVFDRIIKEEGMEDSIIQTFERDRFLGTTCGYEYRGVTPIMQAVVDRDTEKFKMLLDTCSPEDIEQQIKVLRFMVRCVAQKDDQGKVMHYNLKEYEEKNKWALRLCQMDKSIETIKNFKENLDKKKSKETNMHVACAGLLD